MSDVGKRLIASAKEALDVARGNPAEGTRESWYDDKTMQWRSRTFKNGEWVKNYEDNE